MPVVKKMSDLFRDTQAMEGGPDPLKAKGRIILATALLENAADDSSGSTFRLAELPSDCFLHEDTFFDVENDGFAQIQIGTLTDAGALVDQTKATENLIEPVAKGDAFHGKELWEVLGMAEDPGGFITLFKHAAADATGAGSMPFRIAYIWR